MLCAVPDKGYSRNMLCAVPDKGYSRNMLYTPSFDIYVIILNDVNFIL